MSNILKSRFEISRDILGERNIVIGDADAPLKDLVIQWIEEGQNFLADRIDFPSLKRSLFFTIQKTTNAGTITLTNNSKTVTGVGTSWLSEDIPSQRIIRPTDVADEFTWMNILSVASDTSLALATEWFGANRAGVTYEIVTQSIVLRPDILRVLSVIRHSFIDSVPQAAYQLRASEDAISKRFVNTRFKGEPVAYSLGGETGFSETAGTVSVTNGSPTVTGSGTAFLKPIRSIRTIAVAGHSIFQVDADTGDNSYQVQKVTTDTSLTLERNYDGVTGSGKAYQILFNTKLLNIFPPPTDAETTQMRVEVILRPPNLATDLQIPKVDNDMLTLYGIIRLRMKENSDPSRYVSLLQQRMTDFGFKEDIRPAFYDQLRKNR